MAQYSHTIVRATIYQKWVIPERFTPTEEVENALFSRHPVEV
jgi:hypothetical protein